MRRKSTPAAAAAAAALPPATSAIAVARGRASGSDARTAAATRAIYRHAAAGPPASRSSTSFPTTHAAMASPTGRLPQRRTAAVAAATPPSPSADELIHSPAKTATPCAAHSRRKDSSSWSTPHVRTALAPRPTSGGRGRRGAAPTPTPRNGSRSDPHGAIRLEESTAGGAAVLTRGPGWWLKAARTDASMLCIPQAEREFASTVTRWQFQHKVGTARKGKYRKKVASAKSIQTSNSSFHSRVASSAGEAISDFYQESPSSSHMTHPLPLVKAALHLLRELVRVPKPSAHASPQKRLRSWHCSPAHQTRACCSSFFFACLLRRNPPPRT